MVVVGVIVGAGVVVVVVVVVVAAVGRQHGLWQMRYTCATLNVQHMVMNL